MKTLVLCTSALLAAAPACAQSSLTIFGVIDANFQRASQGGVSVSRMLGTGSNASSRLGFRGTEDLGGGMSASFWLESSLNIDDGKGVATNANNQAAPAAPATPAGQQGLTFDRRSTVSINHSVLGELRLGRDYTPSFWNLTTFDPFGTVGSGGSRQISQNTNFGNIGGRTSVAVRASNSIGYFLPKLGGFYGQYMHAFGENLSNAANANDGKYDGVRVGYSNAQVNIAIAHGRVRLAAGDVTASNVGASWTFGSGKAVAQWFTDDSKAANAFRTKGYLLGGSLTVGVGEIPFTYTVSKEESPAGRRAAQLAAGYVHNLSKRTAVYTNVARIKNSNGSAVSGNGGVPGAANKDWRGFDLGIRHTF